MDKERILRTWSDPANVAERNERTKVRMPKDDRVDAYDGEGRFTGVGGLYTALPNELITAMMYLEKSEISVLLVIVQQTYGYRAKRGRGDWKPKECDRIAISQFEQATRLTKKAILDAISLLEERGLIEVDRSGTINAFNVRKRGVERVTKEKATKKRRPKTTSAKSTEIENEARQSCAAKPLIDYF